MLFRKNKYTTPEIDSEIKEKGFGVYNYISLKELLLTVQRDYLAILSKVNIFFGITTIILGIGAFISGSFGFLVSFLLIAYSIIFIILLIKLIRRSFYYLYVSNVVYTNKGIILGDTLHLYKDETNLEKKLLDYEEMFDEFLSRPSKLEQVILEKKSQVLTGTAKTGKKVFDVMGDMDVGNSKEGAQLALAVIVSYGVYTILLYVFYYIGYFFGYIMFYFVSLFLKAIFYFKENIEIKIKQKIEGIDNNFVTMVKIDEILSHKISNFKDGEISNIASFIESHFKNFYSEILLVLKQRGKLLKIIKNSKYKDFIDFVLLEKYIKNHFNKPVKEMISMLNRFQELLEKQISLIKKAESNQVEFSANLIKKEAVLNHQLEVLKLNKIKLEKTLI